MHMAEYIWRARDATDQEYSWCNSPLEKVTGLKILQSTQNFNDSPELGIKLYMLAPLFPS